MKMKRKLCWTHSEVYQCTCQGPRKPDDTRRLETAKILEDIFDDMNRSTLSRGKEFMDKACAVLAEVERLARLDELKLWHMNTTDNWDEYRKRRISQLKAKGKEGLKMDEV